VAFVICLLGAIVGTTIWVGLDSSERRMGVFTWTVLTLFLWPVIFPMYLWQRRKYRPGRVAAGRPPGYIPPPMPPSPGLPPANWYPDPENPQRLRWWDGQRWTGQRSPDAPPG
jgi:hypothetical protein